MKQLIIAGLLTLIGFSHATEFLPVDEAFHLDVSRDGDRLMLNWDIVDDYYLYRDQHKLDTFDGAAVGPVTLSDNSIVKYDVTFDEELAVYYGTMSASYPVTAQEGYVQVTYQGCADAGLCYPPQKRYFDLQGNAVQAPGGTSAGASAPGTTGELISFADSAAPASSAGAPASRAHGFTDAASQLTLATALVFALIGGLVLNLMPCVFPVLSLKAMHLAQYGTDKDHARLHGWIYTAGVVLSFLAVAAVLLVLRHFGTWVGWGYQLQSPYFVAFLILLFFFLALVMMGSVEVGQRLMGVGQGLTQKPGPGGTFFTGVLATLVATPCTAPFMGAAIGFALLQPAGTGLLIFAVMGLGMALPLLLLTYIPRLAERMPTPGTWMVTFRQLMAFPLFATVLWLLWVLVELRESSVLLTTGLGLLLLSLAVWPALNVGARSSFLGAATKRVIRTGALVLAVVLVMDQREREEIWQPYDAALLDRYVDQGQPVFLDVTAAWCITCKANERVALSGETFERLVEANGIQLLKADWTNPSPAVDALIASFDRQGVPLYAFYPAGGGEPKVLPQLLTPGLIRETFTAM